MNFVLVEGSIFGVKLVASDVIRQNIFLYLNLLKIIIKNSTTIEIEWHILTQVRLEHV